MTKGNGESVRPVTIVIPVYGDLPSLSECLDSVIEHVDLSMHRVLLANDSGPDADLIETVLLERIAAYPSIRYHRNETNLGFVGNCNRAVLEIDQTDNDILLLNSDTLVTAGFLDELSSVLRSSDAHGAVCPRSNNATIASLPFALRDPSRGRTIERTAAVHKALAAELPRFTYSPVAMGFCILIRRELIQRFGLFDEVYAPGYGEENDFCLRVGRAGFRSLIAHHALVFHQGARSFVGARRDALRSSHEKILVSRYPEYTSAVRNYIFIERDPVDVFADTLHPADSTARILIDLGADGAPGGSPASALITGLIGRNDVVVTVSAPAARVSGIRRRFPAVRVVRADHLNGLWDAGVALGGVEPHQRARLNRSCLRILTPGRARTSPGRPRSGPRSKAPTRWPLPLRPSIWMLYEPDGRRSPRSRVTSPSQARLASRSGVGCSGVRKGRHPGWSAAPRAPRGACSAEHRSNCQVSFLGRGSFLAGRLQQREGLIGTVVDCTDRSDHPVDLRESGVELLELLADLLELLADRRKAVDLAAEFGQSIGDLAFDEPGDAGEVLRLSVLFRDDRSQGRSLCACANLHDRLLVRHK